MDIDDEVIQLKRKIITLEWDIHFIRNNELKTFKEQQLMEYKMMLDKMRRNKVEVA